MGPISLLSGPKRRNHHSSDVIIMSVLASKVNMPKKRRELVYDVIDLCGQGYEVELHVMKGCRRDSNLEQTQEELTVVEPTAGG